MAASTLVALADAVAAELGNAELSQTITVRRLYRPRYQTQDLKDTTVTVVPKGLAIDAAARSGDFWDGQIDLAVQRKLAAESDEEITSLVELVEEIARHFRLKRPAQKADAVCVKVEVEPLYAVEHLDELRTFTSVITLTFRLLAED